MKFLVVIILFVNVYSRAQENDSLNHKKSHFALGFIASSLPKVIASGTNYISSSSIIPDEKFYIGNGLIFGKDFTINKNFIITSSFSILFGKLSYTNYYAYYRYYDSTRISGDFHYTMNYILNSLIFDFGYCVINCNSDRNFFIKTGVSLNQRKLYKTIYNDTDIIEYRYFERFFSKNNLSASPKISIRFEKRFRNKCLFIENECFIYLNDLFMGSGGINYFYNRLIVGFKI